MNPLLLGLMGAGLMNGLTDRAGISSEPRSREPREPTQADLDALAAAQAKRERRARKKMKENQT